MGKNECIGWFIFYTVIAGFCTVMAIDNAWWFGGSVMCGLAAIYYAMLRITYGKG